MHVYMYMHVHMYMHTVAYLNTHVNVHIDSCYT